MTTKKDSASGQASELDRTPNRTLKPFKPGFFKKLVDSMEVGVIVSDHEGFIIYMNQTYARFLEMKPPEQLGRHATDVVANSRLGVVAQTGVAEINYPHKFKDTGFLVHRVPIRDKGKVIAVLGLVLFDKASTASKLAEQVSLLESKVNAYEKELYSLRSTHYSLESIKGRSAVLADLKRQARKAAATELPVLITGESGTGKELFAQGIHHASRRSLYPFVRINCSAIPKDLMEAELFGYEQGAFTGAKEQGKPGKFELARHGSIFLDEIGDLSLEMQPKLLRVLEEKEFERVGGTKLNKADFRLLAATNRDLENMMQRKRFREDLFYRLNVIHLHIPPLRERRDDILPIARHLLDRITHNSYPIHIDPRAGEALCEHDWPGNVRELSNLLERVASFLEGDTIHIYDLPLPLFNQRTKQAASGPPLLKDTRLLAEREMILRTLRTTSFNKVKAAKLLGIHRSLLYKKMKDLNIPLTQKVT